MLPDEAERLARANWGVGASGDHYWGANPREKSQKGFLEPETWFSEVFELLAKDFEHRMDAKDIANSIAADGSNYLGKAFAGMLSQKALSSSSVSVMIPTVIDAGVVDTIARDTPVYGVMPKSVQVGKRAHVVKRTGGISPDFFSEANYIAGTGNTVADQTYTEAFVDMKILAARGQVGHFAREVTKTQLNILDQEIKDHYLDFVRVKEQILLRGKVADGAESWSGYLTSNAAGYDGIAKSIFTGDAAAGDYYTELSGQYIHLAHLDTMITWIADQGKPVDMIACDHGTFTRLRAEARTQQRLEETQLMLGASRGKPFLFDGIPVVPTSQLPMTTAYRSVFALNFDSQEYRVLLPDTLKIEAEGVEDATTFQWKAYEAYINVVPSWNACYLGGT